MRVRTLARPVLGGVVALVLFVALAGAGHGQTRTQSAVASRASAGRVPAQVELILERLVPTTAAPTTTTVPVTTTAAGAPARPTTPP